MAYPSRKRKSNSTATSASGMKRSFKRARRALFPAAKTAKAKKMKSRLTAMLQGQTKESALTAVVPDAALATGGTISRCLTGMGPTAGVSASASGQVVTDEDSALIDAFHYKGTYIANWTQPDGTVPGPAGIGWTIRHLYVWWNRPIEVASAAGTLPSLGNVLQEISPGVYGPNCHFLAKNVTDKRFTILADYTHYFDNVRGPVVKHFDDYVKINKIQKYMQPATEALPGGHYDSDQLAGQVSTGLPVLYIVVTENGAASATGDLTALSCKGRLIYTA